MTATETETETKTETKEKNVKRVLYMPENGIPIANLEHVSMGYYNFRGGGGEKQMVKHIIRVYADSMYMIRNMINQFETLEASVAVDPESGIFMGQKLRTLRKMLRSLEKQHQAANNKLAEMGRVWEEKRKKFKH